MPLYTLLRAELAYGTHPLLDRAEFALEPGERVGLIGRNGTGKSSLLGVLAGRVTLDDGELQRANGLRIAEVAQEPELPQADCLRTALAASSGLAATDDERERWRAEARLIEYMHRFGVDGS